MVWILNIRLVSFYNAQNGGPKVSVKIRKCSESIHDQEKIYFLFYVSYIIKNGWQTLLRPSHARSRLLELWCIPTATPMKRSPTKSRCVLTESKEREKKDWGKENRKAGPRPRTTVSVIYLTLYSPETLSIWHMAWRLFQQLIRSLTSFSSPNCLGRT